MQSLMDAMWSRVPGNLSLFFLQLTGVLILTCAALKAIQLFQTRQKWLKALKDFLGPPPHWLYGHMHMMGRQTSVRNILKWTEEFPRCFSIWYGGFIAALAINHPEYAKAV